MPIGTTSTALIIKTYKPKITRLPQKDEQKSFWWLLLETAMLTVLTTAAAAATGGVASGAVLALGASDFAASIASFTTRVLVEFAVNQIIDEIQQQATKNTVLNLLLPIAFNANTITRGYRTTKILKLAKSTKTLKKLGIQETNNIQQIINKLNNTKLLTDKINGKKQLFNFAKMNREKVLQNIGFVTHESFKFNFQKLSINEIKENILLQVNLAKLSPKLLPNLKIKNFDNINSFLKRFGTDYDTVIKMNQFEWLNLISEIQRTNSGKALVLTLQQVRNTTLKYNFNNKIISDSLNKINRTFKYFNINYYIDKGIEKIWENTPYFAKLKEKILILQQRIEKIEKQVTSKIEKLKINAKELFSNTEKNIITKFNLIPLVSPVFLACKIEPVTIGKCIITIFYKDERYDPIVIFDTLIKVEIFISQAHPFFWYWNNSGWALGYGIKKNNVINFVKLLPGVTKKAAKEALKINFQIKIIKHKYQILEKGLFNQNFNNKIINQSINFGTRTVFKNKSTRLLSHLIQKRVNYKKVIKNSSKNIRKKLINKGIK